MRDKSINVAFANKKLESDFENLHKGKFEEKQLYKFIERAIIDLKKNPICGTKIPKKLWPKSYIKEYYLIEIISCNRIGCFNHIKNKQKI